MDGDLLKTDTMTQAFCSGLKIEKESIARRKFGHC